MIPTMSSAAGAHARALGLGVLLAGGLTGAAMAGPVPIDPSGALSVPAFEMPSSGLMSEEGNRSRLEHITTERALSGKSTDEANAALFGPRLEIAKGMYKVRITPSTIAGVKVLIYEPERGVAADMRGRVLINVHGGGFVGCFVECGGLESIPVAALSGGRVISIDYRLGPVAAFPQASEDVAAVYREVLKTTDAKRIGLYGCSAGGALTGQALAWFQKQGLPTPGAAGIFCAGASSPTLRGDSQIIGNILGDGVLPEPRPSAPAGPARGYMRTASATDPLAYPANDPAVLRRFPPTLVVVGTRDFALSSSVYLHSRLVANDVDARLHVWEGGRHAFFYDPRTPESREAQAVIAAFFKRNLAP